MMSETNEKQTTAFDAEPLEPASLHTTDGAKNSGGSDDEPAQSIKEDQYPHGLKAAILAAASVVAVFLIALDQVCAPPIHSYKVDTLTREIYGLDYCWHSHPQDHR
jgi:hypothetical protein